MNRQTIWFVEKRETLREHLINGYASRTASQLQQCQTSQEPVSSLVWSKAHDLVQNTDHPSLLSPFGITPKFDSRTVSIQARILYDLGSHKIQKKSLIVRVIEIEIRISKYFGQIEGSSALIFNSKNVNKLSRIFFCLL